MATARIIARVMADLRPPAEAQIPDSPSAKQTAAAATPLPRNAAGWVVH